MYSVNINKMIKFDVKKSYRYNMIENVYRVLTYLTQLDGPMEYHGKEYESVKNVIDNYVTSLVEAGDKRISIDYEFEDFVMQTVEYFITIIEEYQECQ